MSTDPRLVAKWMDGSIRTARHLLVPLLLLVAGVSVAQVQAKPRLDPHFGAGGWVKRSDMNLNPGTAVVEDRGGRLITVGDLRGVDEGAGCRGYFVAAFTRFGATDRSFGKMGLIRGEQPCRYRNALGTFRDGGVVIAGSGGASLPCAVTDRFTKRGHAASGWKRAGKLVDRAYCYGPKHGRGGISTQDLAVDKRGRFLIAGSSQWGQARSVGVIFRVMKSGHLDPSWRGAGQTRSGERGVVRLGSPSRSLSQASEVKALGNGKVLSGGTLRGKFAAFQMLNDGRPDRGFGTRGLVSFDADGSSTCDCSEATAMIRDYRKRIILAGVTYRRNGGGPKHGFRLVLARLRADGSRDRSFGDRGVSRPLPGGFITTGVAVQRDGKIVVSGERNNEFTLIRLLKDGRLDRGFFDKGVFARKVSPLGGSALDVMVDSRGRIVASGGVSSSNPRQSKLAIARILPD